MCGTIHKALQIMHITSVKCDVNVKVRGVGGGGHGLSVTKGSFTS